MFGEIPRIKFGQETEVTKKMLIGFPLSASRCYYALIINYALHVLAYEEKAMWEGAGGIHTKMVCPNFNISGYLFWVGPQFPFLCFSKIIFSCKMKYLNDKNFRILLPLLFYLFVSGWRVWNESTK